MKLQIISANKDYVRYADCPVCGKSNTIMVRKSKLEDRFTCWYCDSIIGWSVEDEEKEKLDENTR